MHVIIQFAALHIEHVDKHFNISKNIVLLRCEVLFHKGFLAATIPTSKINIDDNMFD